MKHKIGANITDLERKLGGIKGEESVFSLYNGGEHAQIKRLNSLFMATKLYDVERLREAIAKEGRYAYGRRVINVKGDKGVGKSTLVAVAAFSQLIDGKISYLEYVRYNPHTQVFDRLFEAGDHKTTSMRMTVIDDIHYFIPEFHKSVIVKGSVSYFDTFVKQLTDISLSHLQNESKSILVYISDTYSFAALKILFDDLLFASGKGELLRLLPAIRKNTGSLSNTQGEVVVDGEFYGKSYALAGGDLALYYTASVFGEIISKETGMMATKARLLRFIIDQLKPYKSRIEGKLLRDKEVAASIFSGEIGSAAQAGKYYLGAIKNEISNYLGGATEVVNPFCGKSQIYYLISDINRNKAYYSSLLNPRDSYPLQKLGDKLSVADKKLSELRSRLQHHSRAEIEVEITASEGDPSTAVKVFEAQKQSVNERLLEIRKLLDEAAKQADELYQDMRFRKLHPDKSASVGIEARGFITFTASTIKKLAKETKLFGEAEKKIAKLSVSTKERASQILKKSSFYSQIEADLKGQQEIYRKVLEAAKEYVNGNENTVTLSDVEEIKKIIDDPESIRRQFNPNTISLIRNLSILPYYSIKRNQ